MKRIQILLILVFNILLLQGQNLTQIPSVYSNIIPNEQGQLVFTPISGGEEGILTEKSPFYTLDNLRIQPTGTQEGLQFDFKNEKFTGTLYCGFYAHNTSKFPQAVFFDKAIPIVKGVAEVNLASKTGKYDIAHWEEKGQAKLGYRITDAYGKIIYNGKINVEG